MQRNAIGSLIFALHLHYVLGYIERTERFKYGTYEGFTDCVGVRGLERKEIGAFENFWGITLGIPKRSGYNVVCNAVTR